MKTVHSYEDMGWGAPAQPIMLEAWSPSAIKRWYETIKYEIKALIEKWEGKRNFEYARYLRNYSNIWDQNPISDSINVEELRVLKAAADTYADMKWDEQYFFVGLTKSLSELLADQRGGPTGVDMNQNMGMVGGAGGGGSFPPMGTEFGPEGPTPPGMGAGEEEGGAGGPEPLPGAEGPPGAPPGGPEGEVPPGGPEAPGARRRRPGEPPPA